MILILNKTYSDEELIDIEQDIIEAINDANIPSNKYGMTDGTYTVRVEWVNNEI